MGLKEGCRNIWSGRWAGRDAAMAGSATLSMILGLGLAMLVSSCNSSKGERVRSFSQSVCPGQTLIESGSLRVKIPSCGKRAFKVALDPMSLSNFSQARGGMAITVWPAGGDEFHEWNDRLPDGHEVFEVSVFPVDGELEFSDDVSRRATVIQCSSGDIIRKWSPAPVHLGDRAILLVRQGRAGNVLAMALLSFEAAESVIAACIEFLCDLEIERIGSLTPGGSE